jgi:Holliday junction resolvase RusA-like endonuclease
MQINIVIEDVKPITHNNAIKPSSRGKFVTMYKTEMGKKFETEMQLKLCNYLYEFDRLNKSYREDEHYLVVDFRFYMPVLTQKKLISKKSCDVDGLIKYTQDVIFEYLEPDDSQIISVSSTKIHSEKFRIEADIKVRSLNNIL